MPHQGVGASPRPDRISTRRGASTLTAASKTGGGGVEGTSHTPRWADRCFGLQNRALGEQSSDGETKSGLLNRGLGWIYLGRGGEIFYGGFLVEEMDH
jgi:hypothetical protein